jgi:protein-serine/threonine kinase
MDLIESLIAPREKRLCSRMYHENDCRGRRPSRCGGGPLGSGVFVYPNDAEDIKSHPWFRDLDWTRLHTSRPPFVPRVRENQPITKYFEDEPVILGISADNMWDASTSDAEEMAEPAMQKKQKKRPRDKVLRDTVSCKTALAIRKASAFIGYTYRRVDFDFAPEDFAHSKSWQCPPKKILN